MDNKLIILSILAIFFIALPSLAHGTEHIVGDYYGWTLGFNYTAWAEHRVFRVGDTLVFNYEMGKHNVYKVGGPDFLTCRIPAGAQALTTGKDIINLATPGKKWYVCGVANHCGSGMKLVINVQPAETWNNDPAPPPVVPVSDGSKTFIVGDDKGWRSYFDYNNWAKGKVFRVGDVLLFKYSPGSHNVFKVDGPNFKACTSPANAEALTTGNDMITLATPGKKWYICGVSNHCQTGQKLFIDVLPPLKALAPPPSVAVPSTGKIHLVGDYSGWTLNFNYAAWAQGKEFRVGDKLVFKYPVGKHNVYKVGGPDFQTCSVPVNTVAMTTGYDVITLQTPGRKWYLCGVGNGKHCQCGMRLVIDVLPATWQAPPHHGY